MPIHVGIACESCERVYFIARTDRIEFLTETGEYQLICPPPCGMTRRFDNQRLAPFAVRTQYYSRGYANKGD
jgi:RNase P subunit RPR2